MTTLRQAGISVPSAKETGCFVLLDGARIEGLPAIFDSFEAEYRPLLLGAPEEVLPVGPFVAQLSGNEQLREWVLDLPGETYGCIILSARRSLMDVRRSLRSMLHVQITDLKETLLFRFYDPRVLSAAIDNLPPSYRDEILWRLGATCLYLHSDPHSLALSPRLVLPPNDRAPPPPGLPLLQMESDMLEAFEHPQEERDISTVAKNLMGKRNLPDDVFETLRQHLSGACKVAKGYGIHTLKEFEAYATVVLDLEADPGAEPETQWVREILEDPVARKGFRVLQMAQEKGVT